MLDGGARQRTVPGPGGPPNLLSIRNVSTGAAGSQAQAQINGSTPNQTLDLVIPKGDPGPVGPIPWAPIVAWFAGQICTATAPATTVYVGGSAYVCAISHVAGTFADDLAAGKWAPVAPAGQPGANGNTIQNGSGAPAGGLGANGDFYIDTANARLYGPKASGAWPGGYTSLIGAGALLAANNLSDVASPGLALANLWLPPASPSASASLLASAAGQDQLATGTITLTMPNGGAKWRSGIIKNANPLSGLVTLAVPASATLDGVTNGTTVLFPFQRARILQIGAAAYVTDWVERTPVIASIPITAAVTSVAAAFPAGWSALEVVFGGITVSAASQVGLQFSLDGGASFKTGASDYQNVSLDRNDSATAINNAATNLIEFFGNLPVSYSIPLRGKGLIYQGSASLRPVVQLESTTYANSQNDLRLHGGSLATLTAISAVRLIASSANLQPGGFFELIGKA
ncbi:MAG: hypothetical protein INR63_12835 [Actinomycetospora chiangmaiensis]|nr:hypothetical protein [Actinomycetospora chiangmaiensis]